jgi:hypothetical protein
MKPALLLLAAVVAHAQPCVTATPACTEWIQFGGGPERSLIYRSFPLNQANPNITRVLIVVHGGGRDADGYFRAGLAAAFLAGALENTVIISPRFASNNADCRDSLASNEVNWDCGADHAGGWRSGYPAVNAAKITTFDFTDEILRRVARKAVFPNLKAITVSGFSGGGQYVSRYAMANQVHETLGIPVTYVVGSTSSYAYPDAVRPALGGSGFGPFADAKKCTSYNQWPYGFEARAGYTAKLTDAQLKTQLLSRPVTYLLGELETPQSPALDVSCSAEAQGASRLTRGQAFFKYVTEKYGSKHKLVIVPQCGHSTRCMFTAEVALPILFPKP